MSDDKLFLNKFSHIHFIGIGGISMSGLAQILFSRGFIVTGSDQNPSAITENLLSSGIKVLYGHQKTNIAGADLIVYTAAIKEDNEELIASRKSGAVVISRARLIGYLMKTYKSNIAVSGTHGKTTTTSMISTIMLNTTKNPTVHVGGNLNFLNGATKIGGDALFITEACEYCDSFLSFYPDIAVILNIEYDHADYFDSIGSVVDSFKKFADLVPKAGYIIGCGDDKNVVEVLDQSPSTPIYFGIYSDNLNWSASNIIYDKYGFASFDLFHNKKKICNIKLSVPGEHNIYNSLAACAACHAAGADMDEIINSLILFTGTERRQEYKGAFNGIKLFDDYAHHPSEVKVTLRALKRISSGQLFCVFQPHTYTRTKTFLNDFIMSFDDADKIVVIDIYAAREKDPGDINSKQIVDGINAVYTEKAVYLDSFMQAAKYLSQNASTGDTIVTMGAGDVDTVGHLLQKIYAWFITWNNLLVCTFYHSKTYFTFSSCFSIYCC